MPVLAALAVAGCGSSGPEKTVSAPFNSTVSSGKSSTAGTQTAGAGVKAPGSASMKTATGPAASATSTAAAGAPGTMGPEGIPLEAGATLAPASSTLPGKTVDGIQCAPIEQLAYHIHAHLQVYVNGQPRALPAAIGMIDPVAQNTPKGPFYGAQKCYYWLHTHTTDGVIHIESPTPRTYTLGNFFNEWDQPLSAKQVASDKGKVTATVNGKRWTKSPRAIKLKPHTVIQLAVGSPVPRYHKVDWTGTGL